MSIQRTVEIDLSPRELAASFCDMSNIEQALFFGFIAEISAEWPGAGWCQQSCNIAQSLQKPGREVVLKLAEHIVPEDSKI